MNTKSIFILAAAILLTSTLLIGLNAAQPANAKKVIQYCSTPSTGSLGKTFCKDTLLECEEERVRILLTVGGTATDCSEERIKVKKAK